MSLKTLAAKAAVVVALVAGWFSGPAYAGIPVIDAANLGQNLIAAIENVAQTAKLIQAYSTQLQQYENQLQNTMAPASYTWDQAQTTINGLVTATNTLNHYKQQLGNVDNYISKFQDVAYYQNSRCFTVRGCSAAEWAAMEQNRRLASESQKKANDALFRGLDQQQANLQNDAATLQRLQAGAQGATGQMQAIGYANQLASQQSNQLLQIRALMIAQHNAMASRMQADADKEAQQAAAAAQLRTGAFRASAARNW